MKDFLPLDNRFFIALLLILLGLVIRFVVHKFLNFVLDSIENRGKEPSKLYLFFDKCCMIAVNWVIPFVLFTFIAVLLGE
jgi:hypothetical protein